MTARPEPSGAPWLAALRWYLPLVLVANLAWETAQLPLYTIWREGSARTIAFAVVHCTLGDGLIAGVSLVLALVLVGRADWPRQRFAGVAAAATILGAGYTVWSEWLNATIRGAWAYAVAMPRVPPLGTGLAPLAQWLILPALCLTATRHAVRGSSSPAITRSEATAAPSPPRAASSKH